MGTRPQFFIIVGINDAKKDDPRHTPVDELWLEEILYSRDLTREECWRQDEFYDDYHDWELKIPGMTLDLYDKLYNPEQSGDYGVDGLLGYIVASGKYDDIVIRALATLDPKFSEPGYFFIPTLDPEEHKMRYRRYRYTPRDVECNRFVEGIFESSVEMSRMEWSRAMHYLKLIGWDIPETDLRYMLVWSWS